MLIDAVLIDDVADIRGFMAAGDPDEEVVLAMGGRGVDETGTRIVGDMVAGEHGDWVFVKVRERVERMG